MTFLLAEKILLIAGLMAIIFIGSELLTRVALLVKRLVQKRVRKQTEEELLYKAKVQASVRKWLVTRKSYSWLLTGFYLVFFYATILGLLDFSVIFFTATFILNTSYDIFTKTSSIFTRTKEDRTTATYFAINRLCMSL
ncbi:hypothetical protein AB3Q54_10460 [Ligilactobacillus agilis]|uniref:Uncharacterized protein n=1 Tax=Ligilactobacillus agilis TaxID=1601 RepID=A0A6F9Y5Q8_9LACO|nr:hypothetical protein [Ligilactobacillus agilis]GET12903.1 hypothetical protein SN811_14030 [Ligilactobacillus agilis]